MPSPSQRTSTEPRGLQLQRGQRQEGECRLQRPTLHPAPQPAPQRSCLSPLPESRGFEPGIGTTGGAAQAPGRLSAAAPAPATEARAQQHYQGNQSQGCSAELRPGDRERREVILLSIYRTGPWRHPHFTEKNNECALQADRVRTRTWLSPSTPSMTPPGRLSTVLTLPATTLQLSKHPSLESLEQSKKCGPWGAFPPLPQSPWSHLPPLFFTSA